MLNFLYFNIPGTLPLHFFIKYLNKEPALTASKIWLHVAFESLQLFFKITFEKAANLIQT